MASFIPSGVIPAVASNFIPAAALTTGAAATVAFPSDEGSFSETILGCPVSSFLNIVSACSNFTNEPACVTATPTADWDSGCCGSISAFGVSAYSCFSDNSPSCLDTAALLSSFSVYDTSTMGETDPCAKFGAMTLTGIATATGTTAGAGKTTATGKSGGSTSNGATATSGSGVSQTGSTTGSAVASATKSSGSTNDAGLKIYFGLGLATALVSLIM